jgi:hypothetical protein
MPSTKPSGEQLADQIRHHDYDPDFMMGFLTSFVGRVADGKTLHSPRKAAREVLESLADFDSFVADVPSARRRQS